MLKLPCRTGKTEWSLMKHVKKVYTLHGYIMRGHATSSSRMSSYFWLVGAIFISLLAGYQDIKPFGIANKWYFEEIWSARSAFCTFFSQFVSGRYSTNPAIWLVSRAGSILPIRPTHSGRYPILLKKMFRSFLGSFLNHLLISLLK